METRRQEFRIGVMVLAAVVSLVLMTMFFGRQPMLRISEENLVQVRFQRSPGIKRNSPVFKNGVQVGRVVKVELVDQDREVEVTLALDKRRKIYTNEECRIRQTVIMGDASLEFVKRTNYNGIVEEIDPAMPLVGVGSSDIMGGFSNIEGDLTEAIKNVSAAADNLGGFIERVNSALGTPEEFKSRQDKFTAIVEETRQAMSSMRSMTDGVNKLVGDPQIQANVRKVMADLPDVIERSRTLVSESTSFVQETRGFIEKGNGSLDTLAGGLDKVLKTLENVTKITEQVEGDVPEIVAAVKKSAVKMESLFSELTMIVSNFRQSDGTVKRLMRDPALYEKLSATLDNVEKITDEVDWLLRCEVKPIAFNVKVLTDKAARDPAIFLRNLLKKEPPVKHLSPYWSSCGTGGTLFGGRCSEGVYEEVIEVIEDTPVPALPAAVRQPVHQPKPMPAPILNFHAARRSAVPPAVQAAAGNLPRSAPAAYTVRAVEEIPEEGRIVNVDPRYGDQ
ncbi:MAG: MlaD family protein [Planctomycetaceae bacterium]|jgi:ABC-type transporter Mla subunit MlaD|nr:MlaD family protein [Planctomycetaceae bacterium]